MPRIKIDDLPQDAVISGDEMKKIRGGIVLSSAQTLMYNSTQLYGAIPDPIPMPASMNRISFYDGAFKF